MAKERISAAQRDKLLRSARAARSNAHCPYSDFAVGAALLTSSGRIFRGVNVENASFGATICAERSALVSAVSAGERTFRALAVVAGGDSPAVPCGQCLQVLAEFCGAGLRIYLATPKLKPARSLTLKDLLPETFNFAG